VETFDPSGGPYGRVGIGIAAYIVGILGEIPFMSTDRRPAAAPEPVRN
jgi:hypothetical protein